MPSDKSVDERNKIDEEDESSDTDENKDDDNATAGEENEPTQDNLPPEADIWGPCTDVPISFQFSGQGGLKNDAMSVTDV